MSEVLATVDPELPSGYEKLDGIEIVEQKDGGYRYNGLIELGEGDSKTTRRVQLPDLAEMWGYDPEQSEAEWQERLADPEKYEMKRQIKLLAQRVEALEKKNAKLEEEIKVKSKEPVEEPEEYAGFSKGDKVGVRSGDKYVLGYAVTGFTEPDESGRRKIKIEHEEIEEERIVPPWLIKKDEEIEDEDVADQDPADSPERPRRTMLTALLALGGAALAGFIGYEIAKSGHSSSVDVSKIHQQISSFEAQSAAQHIHDHKQEMQAINGLREQVNQNHAQEMKAIHNLTGLHEHAQNTGAYWAVRYPWDWAANKVGALRAEGWLHALAARAMQHGHSVSWLSGGHGTEILQVDGRTNTSYVVNVLEQYR